MVGGNSGVAGETYDDPLVAADLPTYGLGGKPRYSCSRNVNGLVVVSLVSSQ